MKVKHKGKEIKTNCEGWRDLKPTPKIMSMATKDDSYVIMYLVDKVIKLEKVVAELKEKIDKIE